MQKIYASSLHTNGELNENTGVETIAVAAEILEKVINNKQNKLI